jgi:hypothetical protein
LGRNCHALTVVIGKNGVLAAHQIFSGNPVLYIDFSNFIAGAYNINDPKTATDRNIDVTLVVVFWQHVAATTLFQKVDATHIVTFEKHVLLINEHNRLHKGANPGQK